MPRGIAEAVSRTWQCSHFAESTGVIRRVCLQAAASVASTFPLSVLSAKLVRYLYPTTRALLYIRVWDLS